MATLVNLAKVFEEIGMNERTAKSQATRSYNKAEVEAVDGLVMVEDFLKATAQYEDVNNTSKYKAGILAARTEVKAGKIKATWQEKTEATAKANPFDDTKVLKALLKLKPELVEVVGKIRAEIEAAKAE
jgi:post-segregation antitoxin (ccd killing protein)